MPTTLIVGDTPVLKMKLKPGMHVRVGDAVVTFIEREGEAAYVAFQAPRSVPIFRDGRLSVRERQRYGRGPSSARRSSSSSSST